MDPKLALQLFTPREVGRLAVLRGPPGARQGAFPAAVTLRPGPLRPRRLKEPGPD
jgi:hypothetical protein